MEVTRAASLIAATITTGLIAGLFFAFTYSVMPGLAQTTDRTFVEAMQRINVAIVNGWFLSCFLGALVFGIVATAFNFGNGAVFGWALAGTVCYVATLIITVRFNIPLNDALPAAVPDDPGAIRRQFEAPWIRWNLLRVVTSLGAFGCLVGALVTR